MKTDTVRRLGQHTGRNANTLGQDNITPKPPGMSFYRLSASTRRVRDSHDVQTPSFPADH